jgi:hypothetical protein
MQNPGRAGLTIDRFGDSEKWIPKSIQGESGAKLQAEKVSDPITVA